MNAQYQNESGTITLSFPKKRWDKLIKAVKIESDQALSEDQIKQIFSQAVKFFLKGKLSTDDIACISNNLLEQMYKIEDKEYPELQDALEAGAELEFYVRKPKLLGQFKQFLEEVIDWNQ